MIADEILRQVQLRGVGKTICPSEVARTLFPDDWREHMDDVREAAGLLAAAGSIVVTQRGKAVDVSAVRGPIRLGLPSDRPETTD